MIDITPETPNTSSTTDIVYIKKFLTKHKTTIVMGAALAASITMNLVQKAMVLPSEIDGWTLHYVAPEALACLDEHMPEDFPYFPGE